MEGDGGGPCGDILVAIPRPLLRPHAAGRARAQAGKRHERLRNVTAQLVLADAERDQVAAASTRSPVYSRTARARGK
jgi:hypothetical protein